jgi:hypothetical protein
MPKKGVLGEKRRPKDEYVTEAPMPMPERPVTLELKKAKSGGYIVCKRGGKLGYEGEEHIAKSKEDLLELVEKHLA